MGKLHNLESFPQGLRRRGVHAILLGKVIRSFNCAESKGYFKILIGCLRGKGRGTWGSCPPNLFGHLKSALEVLTTDKIGPLLIF